MEDLSKFKNKIFIYGILVMLIMEVISLPFLGFNLKFSYGLLLGTAISVLNFNIMAFTMSSILSGKNKFFATISYLLRLVIYGGAFFTAMKIDKMAGLGCLLGFVTLKIAIFYIHGFKPKMNLGKIEKDKENKYKKTSILIKDPYKIRYCKGRAVMTHKRLIDYEVK